MKRKFHFRLWLLLLAAFLAVATIFIESRLRPALAELAVLELENRVSLQIDEACAASGIALPENGGELVTLRQNDTGRVIALTVDTNTLNRLRSAVISQITEQINGTGRERISIPIGAVLPLPLLTGLGPEVSVELLDFGSVGAELETYFEESGINQTIHRIDLTVSGEAVLMLPGGMVHRNLSTTVTVAETVLLGDVPATLVQTGAVFSAADSLAEEPVK